MIIWCCGVIQVLLYISLSSLYLHIGLLFQSPVSPKSADFGPGDTFRVPLIGYEINFKFQYSSSVYLFLSNKIKSSKTSRMVLDWLGLNVVVRLWMERFESFYPSLRRSPHVCLLNAGAGIIHGIFVCKNLWSVCRRNGIRKVTPRENTKQNLILWRSWRISPNFFGGSTTKTVSELECWGAESFLLRGETCDWRHVHIH